MADMPRCKTCKHWNADSYKRAFGLDDAGYCHRMDGVTILLHGSPNVTATLATNPRFGCVEHEERT